MKIKIPFFYPIFLLVLVGAVAGCNDSNDNNPAATSTTISGSVFAAPIAGADVTVKDINGNTVAGPVSTNTNGNYQVEIPNEALSGALVFQSTGGSFDDEATGDTSVAAGTMSAYIKAKALSAGMQVHMTPGSTIVRQMMSEHGMLYSDAQDAFNGAFGYVPDTGLVPSNAVSPGASANDSQKLAGLHAAAFSQLALKLGISSAQQFDLYAALADDLSDGALNGQNANGAVAIGSSMKVLPEDIQNQYVQALVDFRASGNDHTELANDKIGQLPFAKVALTDSYRIEYVPGMMSAMEGKSQFNLRVTDRYTQAPVSGLNIMLMPMMYMAMHHHGTPVDGVVDNGDGTYTATVYYLMASSMMNGMPMGYWQLMVTLGGMNGESTYFYPKVMMNMSGDSAQARLKGQNDLIPGMGMGGTVTPEMRTYYLFNDGLSGSTDNHTFNLFIAAKESMMSYPAIETGMTLNAGDVDYELAMTSITVEVSSDATNWVSATENGHGHWTAAGISGLTDNTEGTLYVKLGVNGEQKTTDGNAPTGDGSNDFAMFSLTPGGTLGGM
jgi:hypothetical protein